MKEWLRVSHTAQGQTTVTVTVQDGNLTARWSVKAFTTSDTIKAGVVEARWYATQALEALRSAME